MKSASATTEHANMNDLFSDWLSSGSAGPCCIQGRRCNYILIRVEKNADFEYLYCQEQYGGIRSISNEKFEFAGIYCRKDGLLYDAGNDLTSIAEDPEPLKARSAQSLRKRLEADVRAKVEAVIGNDRNNLQITELTSLSLIKNLEYAYQYHAAEDARKHYLSIVNYEHRAFSCNYVPAQWTEETLLSYIADPEGYIQEQVEHFITNNQENMLYDFLYHDAVWKEYQAILADTENPVHIIKKISAAMAVTTAKMVNVTVLKNGTEFTFKTEASDLRRDCSYYYSTSNILAADRRKFKKLFGKSANYTPEEIVRITYAKNVLYEAEQK